MGSGKSTVMDNLAISHDGFQDWQGKHLSHGICFSKQSVGINQPVCIKVTRHATKGKHSLKVGLTNFDPEKLPDEKLSMLTAGTPGCWMREFPMDTVKQDDVLFFYLTPQGSITYGIKDQTKGSLCDRINTASLFWAVVVLSGKASAVKCLGEQLLLYALRSSKVDFWC